MDDFRRELTSLVDGLVAAGIMPMFLMVDLNGAEHLRISSNDPGALTRFRETCMDSLSGAASKAEVFSYGDLRIIAVLPGFDRLKTFALVERMRRALPLLAQSFDVLIQPEFDTIEFDEASGVAGVINQIVAPRGQLDAA
jgi:hypothetical protein